MLTEVAVSKMGETTKPLPTRKLKDPTRPRYITAADTRVFVQSMGFDFQVNRFPIQTDPKRGWFRITDSPIPRFYSHLRGEISMSLPRMQLSNYVHIDLDCRDGDRVVVQTRVQRLVETLGEPLYIEHRRENGGYHLIFRFDEALSTDFVGHINSHLFNDKGIEFTHGELTLRLPMSREYNYFGLFDITAADLIQPLTYVEVVERFKQAPTQPLPTILKQMIHSRPVKYIKPSKPKSSKDMGHGFKDQLLSNIIYHNQYGPGERNHAQLRIAWVMKRCRCRFGFEDYVYACYQADNGSEGMQGNSETIETMLAAIWDNCTASPDTEFVNEKIEALKGANPVQLVTDRLLRREFRYEHGLRYQMCLIIDDLSDLKSKKPRQEFAESCVLLLEYIGGLVAFNEFNGVRYREKELQFLNPAFPLSVGTLETIAEELGIRNIARVKKFLIEWGFLIVPKHPTRHIEYCYDGKYHWTKHYKPRMEDAESFLINLTASRLYRERQPKDEAKRPDFTEFCEEDENGIE